MSRSSNPLLRSRPGAVAWWALLGSAVALMLTLLVSVLFLVYGNERFARNGVTLGGTILTYWLGCPLGGALIGWLRPLATRPIVAALVGMVGVLPLYVAAVSTMAGPPWTWPPIRWIGAIVPACFVGGAIGFTWLRYQPRPGEEG